MNRAVAWLLFILLSLTLHADIKSTSGNIEIDPNGDASNEFVLNASGLGIGTTSASANLHVVGNAVMSQNIMLNTSSGKSTLEVNGSVGFGVETISDNTELSGNSIVLVDTSNGNIELSLPYAGNVQGRTYLVKKTVATNEVIVRGGGILDSSEALSLSSANTGFPYLSLFGGNTAWHVTSKSQSGVSDGLMFAENVIAKWSMDDTSGTVASDSGRYGMGGNLINGFTFASNSVVGKVGNALDFDGSDNHVAVDDHDALSFGNTTSDQPLSFSIWVKMDDATHFKIIQKGNPPEYLFNTNGSDKFQMWLHDNDAANYIGQQSTGTVTAHENAWTHLVGTYDGSANASGVVLYINGSVHATGDVTAGTYTAMHNHATGLYIGRNYHNGTRYSNGAMDDVRIYNKVLTADEIQALYQLGQ